MMPILDFKLWYSDGSTFTSRDGSWADAPDTDVQVMCFYHEPPYRTMTHGVDEYRHPDFPEVKYGKWMDAEAYEVLVLRAKVE